MELGIYYHRENGYYTLLRYNGTARVVISEAERLIHIYILVVISLKRIGEN